MVCGIGGGEWGEGAEASSPLEGSRVGEQLCPVVPHTASPQHTPVRSWKGNWEQKRQTLPLHSPPAQAQWFEKLCLRHLASTHCLVHSHRTPSTLTLYPRAAAQSLPTKHSQEVPVAGICSSPETCPAEGPGWPVHIQGLRNSTLSPLAPHPHPEPFWDTFP